jgi:hypothetical protein
VRDPRPAAVAAGPRARSDILRDVAKAPVLSVQPRVLAGLVLIAGGILWALARGLHFYGLAPIDVGYDLDQPPLLLVLVGGWLLYRSRRR